MKLVNIPFGSYILIAVAVFLYVGHAVYAEYVDKAERRRTGNFYSGSAVAESKTGEIKTIDTKGKPIGSITAIEGEVYFSHGEDTTAFPAILGNPIHSRDHIQTKKQSRAQILLKDESVLNLGEDTYIQIKKYVYSPDEGKRSLLIWVERGKVRGTVGRRFMGPSSVYTISHPGGTLMIEHGIFIVNTVSKPIQ